MSYRMIALANRFASHFGGGGGTTTTSSQIPDELKPLVEGSSDRVLGLQDYFWGDADNMGDAGGSRYGGGGGGNWGYANRGGDGGGGGIRRPGGRRSPADLQGAAGKRMAIPRRPGEGEPPRLLGGGAGGGGGGGAGLNIQGENIRDVAGGSALQRWAGRNVQGLGDITPGERKANWAYNSVRGMGGKRITGDEVRDDPAMAAAFDAFNTFDKPMIEDSATAAGFGRSRQKGDKLSMGLQQMMLPQIQAAQGRAERGLDRDLQSYLSAGQGFQGLGAQETSRRTGALDRAMGIGDTQRGIEQERRDAPHEDFIRRAALGESMLTGPFGGLVPSTIGSSVRSSGGK